MAKILGLASLFEPLEFLEEKVQNLNSCSLQDVEVHFRDCSSEPTWREVERLLKDCRFKYRAIHVPERETLYTSWNHLILSSGWPLSGPKYLTNVNVDDTYHPDYFEKLSSFLDQHEDIQLVAPSWYHINLVRGKEVVEDIRSPNPKVTMGHFPMWRAAAHLAVGLFDPRMIVVGDSDFWGRLREKFGYKAFAVIPEPLAGFLWHEKNLYRTAVGPQGQSGEGYDRSL